jgi:hypothetical protein
VKSGNLLLFLVLVSGISCVKEDDIPVPPNPDSFELRLSVDKIVCYPNDSIRLTYAVATLGALAPLTYTWIQPLTNSGAGPFNVQLSADQPILLEVTDARAITRRLETIIQKDTIDSLRYDWRELYLADYTGLKTIQQLVQDSLGNWIMVTNTYTDTVTVSKEPFYFSQLKFSICPSCICTDYTQHQFLGYHTGLHFTPQLDSLYIGYQPGLGPYWVSFRGKKIM